MDKGKIVKLVLIPLVAGLIVTLVVQRMMNTRVEGSAAPRVETVPVVVVAAKAPIPARTKLSESQLAIRQVPKELVTGNEFSQVADVTGQTTVVELQPGEVLLKQRVVAPGQGTLPYRIPDGMRAITIRMDELNGVAGHPEVGDLVDLILFLPEKKIDDPVKVVFPAQSRVLQESVLVLAKGPAQADPAAAKGAEAKLTSITLAVTPAAAVEITLGEQVGYIKMLLRPALPTAYSGTLRSEEAKYRDNMWSLTLPTAPPAQPNR